MLPVLQWFTVAQHSLTRSHLLTCCIVNSEQVQGQIYRLLLIKKGHSDFPYRGQDVQTENACYTSSWYCCLEEEHIQYRGYILWSGYTNTIFCIHVNRRKYVPTGKIPMNALLIVTKTLKQILHVKALRNNIVCLCVMFVFLYYKWKIMNKNGVYNFFNWLLSHFYLYLL